MITVKIPKDRDGRPKQFAFVNFKHEESVPYGLRLLNGIKLYGRPMRIQFRSGTGGTFTTFVGGRELLSAALACSRAIAIRVNCRSLSPRGPSPASSAPLTSSCPSASTRDLLSLMATVTPWPSLLCGFLLVIPATPLRSVLNYHTSRKNHI